MLFRFSLLEQLGLLPLRLEQLRPLLSLLKQLARESDGTLKQGPKQPVPRYWRYKLVRVQAKHRHRQSSTAFQPIPLEKMRGFQLP